MHPGHGQEPPRNDRSLQSRKIAGASTSRVAPALASRKPSLTHAYAAVHHLVRVVRTAVNLAHNRPRSRFRLPTPVRRQPDAMPLNHLAYSRLALETVGDRNADVRWAEGMGTALGSRRRMTSQGCEADGRRLSDELLLHVERRIYMEELQSSCVRVARSASLSSRTRLRG